MMTLVGPDKGVFEEYGGIEVKVVVEAVGIVETVAVEFDCYFLGTVDIADAVAVAGYPELCTSEAIVPTEAEGTLD